ncbi:MAG: TRAP transporter substrate-binding protein DctP [Sedimentibacter sp.]|uniref:TRAP transporter substrate-binding protein DctP n=1 Tax=Sedimentibacter sp. TaxID=1960295 RepID=UPI00315847B0
MKRLKALTAMILVFVIVLTGCSGNKTQAPAATDSGKTIEVTFADYGSSKTAAAKEYTFATEYINKNSNGRLNVKYVPDAVLGNETEMIQQLMDGTMKMATLGTSTFSKFTDKLEVFQLPFLITDYEKEAIAFTSPEGQALLDTAEELGLKIVGYSENGLRHFANNIKPINKPEDLNGIIMRIVPSTMLQKSMELLGANPTPLNYGEIYTALQNKVIDGEETNFATLYAMKHYETIKYVSEIGMYPFPVLIVCNLDFWNSLSTEDQALITEAFDNGVDNLFTDYLPNYEAEARAVCENVGLEFNVIEDKAPFIEKVKPVYEEYKAKDPKIKAFIEMMEGLQ